MARLIDAKKLEQQVKEAFKDTDPVLMGQMLRWIRKQKTCDAVPVVRCKDCKHYVWDEFDGAYVCLGLSKYVKPEFWCAYGERKDND